MSDESNEKVGFDPNETVEEETTTHYRWNASKEEWIPVEKILRTVTRPKPENEAVHHPDPPFRENPGPYTPPFNPYAPFEPNRWWSYR